MDGVDEGESCIWESSPSEAAIKGLEWFEERESELEELEELVGKEGERGGVRRGKRVPERLAMLLGMMMWR